MTPQYDAVYLSPHPDDAVFSCAGSIARRVASGQSVLVVTVCTAVPPCASTSPFAVSLHRRWGLRDAEVVGRRLAEDDAAVGLLGADLLHLGFLDAIYRRADAYDAQERLFGPIAEDDPLPNELLRALTQLCAQQSDARLCAPLAVARHVDHQCVHFAARQAQARGARVSYYEDMPYAVEPGAVERHLAHLGVAPNATPTCENIQAYLDAKIAAMRCYASQVQDLPNMPDEAVAYARGLSDNGRALERTWCLP